MGTIRLFNHPVNSLYLCLILVDACLLVAAVYLGVYLRFAGASADEAGLTPILPRALAFAAVMMLAMVATGLYNRRLRDGLEGILVRLSLSFVIGIVLMSLLFYVVPQLIVGRGAFAISLASAFLLLLLARILFLRLLAQQNIKRRALVLGAGRRAKPLMMLRRRSDLIGISIVGYLPAPGDTVMIDEAKLIRTSLPLSELVVREKIDEIIVAVDDRRAGLPMEELLNCRTRGVHVVDLLTFLENETGKIKLDLMYPSWLAFSAGFKKGLLRAAIKRGFDIVVSLTLLVVTLPLMLAAALAIWLEAGCRGPVLYRQTRVGEAGREFQVLKFRSMRPDAERDGKAQWASEHDPRVTRVGAVLRKYRIDELPQLINVLRGEMSFVGPRPERPEFVRGLQLKLPYYAARHQVKPGLTGWAQISYPYGASEEDAFEKLQYDLYYVKNHSLFLDLTIMLQTAEVVLWGKGAR